MSAIGGPSGRSRLARAALLLLALASLLRAARPAHALDLTVCPLGCPYQQIGAALAAARPGDTIKVAGGYRYAEQLMITTPVTLTGGYDAGFSAPGAAPSVIDGGGAGSTVQISIISGTLVFEGFDVTGGATLQARGGGIGVVAQGGTALIRDNHVYGNSAARGGGIYAQARNDARIVVSANQVDHNSAPLNAQGQSFGAGIEADGDQSGQVLLSDNYVHHNTLTPVSIPGNGGGAIAVDAKDSSAVEVRDNLVAENGGAPGAGELSGAGIYADARNSASVTIAHNRVRGNTGTQGGGIGLLIVGQTAALLLGNQVTDNSAAGGSLALVGPLISANNIIARNSSGVRAGAPFLTTGWQSTNDTIADNGAPGISATGTTTVTLRNAIVWGQAPALDGAVAATFSDVQGGAPGLGNLDLSPRFADAAYHLSLVSPVRNRGSAAGAPADDFEGDPRSPGDGVDMGADELLPRLLYLPLLAR